MTDLEFIKNFSKITITDACKKAGVDRAGLLSARYSNTEEKAKKVRKEIENEIAKLYLKEV